ncbi:hypothetical protein CYMTET_33035 [Cymbomonas tetramitiformis]|uniref:Bacterial transcriptional activator domain-containing protein n=1 Tax=Cymbomonas tetramitiformis TaxID=36881 RepID=A0AAE0FEH4_9CHLO|nr:hypothetical protein CYMTET_33035 [Cymbomonas tetramitiformis]
MKLLLRLLVPYWTLMHHVAGQVLDADALAEQGSRMVLMGNPKQGVEYLREALRLNDRHVNAYVYLGLAKQSISETEPGMRLGSSDLIEAAWAYSRALELAPEMTDASSVTKYLGMVLELLGRHEEAVTWLEKGIERDPTNHDLLYTLARNLDSVGRIEEAISAYRETAKIQNSAMVHGRLCSLKKYTAHDEDFQEMEDLLETETDTKKAAYLGFALGKAYGDIKDYDSAFHHLEQANRRMSKVFVTAGSGHSMDGVRERAHTIKHAFTADPIDGHPLYSASATPIFIVGLPRSGSTLVEKVARSPRALLTRAVKADARAGAVLGTAEPCWELLSRAGNC